MHIHPSEDRIVVKPREALKETQGGILIPEAHAERPQEGAVVAAGPGRLLEDGSFGRALFKVGDQVLYAKYAGHQIKWEDEDVIVMSQSDVLCLFSEEGKAPW